MQDVHRVIGSLQQQGVALHLDTNDLSFLLALRARGEHDALATYDEDLLYDVFRMVCEFTEPDAPNPRKRATHALNRLREQRLLARVDGAGLVRAGEFALTPLADAIVTFFLKEEQLTRESLAALTAALRSHLAETLERARGAHTHEEWQADVSSPLRHSVRELVSGIERRQRGMDAQQEEVRAQIGGLLQRDWFSAIESCESLLEDTSTTLRELNEVLLRDLSHLQVLLQGIEELAAEADEPEAQTAAQALAEQVDRVMAWGGARQRAWSDYYQFVQRYLRDVVRLDPERALSQRLRDQIKGLCQAPYALLVAETTPLRVLRDSEEVAHRPPVTEPREDRDRSPEPASPDQTREELEERLSAALAAGAPTLHSLLVELLPTVPPGQRFLWAGRIIERAGQQARVVTALEPPFVEVAGEGGALDDEGHLLVVQDWTLARGRT